MLLALPPPPDYKVWEPTTAGVPSWWGKPWVKKMTQKGGETKTKPEPVEDGEKVEEPILQVANTLQNPAKQSQNVALGPGEASLLGYFRNLQQDVLSTKKETLNLHPARRGFRPGLACILYLIRRFKWRGSTRTSIFLYGSAMGMNSLTKPTHQVDAELAAIQLAVKETKKCLKSLASVKYQD